MAGEWEGKSKGTVLGYKIFIFFIRKLGVRAAYGLLFFCSPLLFFLRRKKYPIHLLLFSETTKI